MIERLLPAGPSHRVRVRCSDRADGDFRVDRPDDELRELRRRFAPGEWTWLRQVHGPRVVAVDTPGEGAGEEADASVTSVLGAVLAVHTADCVPVVLAADGALAVAHAGWRGVVEGVIPNAVAALRDRAEGDIRALLGPHIGVANYAFGASELEAVTQVAGESARGTTARGGPALDMTAAVTAVLAAAGVDAVEVVDADTADPGWYSHRTRADRGRQVTVAWIERADDRP